MQNDYISRDAAFEAAQQSISDKRSHDFNAGCARAANNVLKIPPADVREVVRAEWTTCRTEKHDGEWYCSNCDYEPIVYTGSLYCPNCGAEMKGGDATHGK